MIFNNKVYVIFVDEKFVGICENENEIWDVAQNEVNGTNYPLTDDNFADRVFWNTIKPNRFYKHSKNVFSVLFCIIYEFIYYTFSFFHNPASNCNYGCKYKPGFYS